MTKTEWGEKRRFFFFIKERWNWYGKIPTFTKMGKREVKTTFLIKAEGEENKIFHS